MKSVFGSSGKTRPLSEKEGIVWDYPSLLEAMLLRGPTEPKVSGESGQQSTVLPKLFDSLCLACPLGGYMWNLFLVLWSGAPLRISKGGSGLVVAGEGWGRSHLTLSPTFSLEVRRYWEFGQRSI